MNSYMLKHSAISKSSSQHLGNGSRKIRSSRRDCSQSELADIPQTIEITHYDQMSSPRNAKLAHLVEISIMDILME